MVVSSSRLLIAALCVCGPLAAAHGAEGTESKTKERAPNVVLILIDNVGYGDLGCYGNTEVKTPFLDEFARQSVRCTSFYIGSPSCMPSRGALLTGRHPLRNGLNEQLWRNPSEQQIGLPHRERLLPQYLKQRGYISGCFGKWNIGFAVGSRPTERGFDEYFGHASGNMHYYYHRYNGRHDLYRGTQPVEVDGYCTDLFANAACEFIARHQDRPFFVYVPFNAAHYPNRRNHLPGEPVIWQAPERHFAAYGWTVDEPDERKRYRAVLTALDEGIGCILQQLDEQKLTDRTLVVFLSDNGAFMLPQRGLEVASNKPLRDGGVTLWEGGIRVPCMIRWPGHLPAGTVCDEPLVAMDLVPLILNAAQVRFPADRSLDGRDPLAALAGNEASPHEQLGFRWEKMSALRAGNYKLVRSTDESPWQLYDLSTDLGEQHDVSAVHPKIVRQMAEQFEKWDRDVRQW
jgi:arylsulfatase A-like enzyme